MGSQDVLPLNLIAFPLGKGEGNRACQRSADRSRCNFFRIVILSAAEGSLSLAVKQSELLIENGRPAIRRSSGIAPLKKGGEAATFPIEPIEPIEPAPPLSQTIKGHHAPRANPEP